MQSPANHPFSGRAGSKRRDQHAKALYIKQLGACRMCGIQVNPSLRGTRKAIDAVVDHVIPWRLRPDLAHGRTNLQLICRACHAVCDGIEKRLAPDIDAIVKAKQTGMVVSVDGWKL